MVNPLSNPAGNVAPRWVYPAILFEMIDKTLYGLHATQRHKEIRGIFNSGVKLDIHNDASLTVLGCDDQWWWKNIFSNTFAWFWCISNNFSLCQGFPVELYQISPTAGQTGAGCRHKELLYTSSAQWTGKKLILPLKFGLLLSLFLCNKYARFHWDIF